MNDWGMSWTKLNWIKAEGPRFKEEKMQIEHKTKYADQIVHAENLQGDDCNSPRTVIK